MVTIPNTPGLLFWANLQAFSARYAMLAQASTGNINATDRYNALRDLARLLVTTGLPVETQQECLAGMCRSLGVDPAHMNLGAMLGGIAPHGAGRTGLMQVV